MKNNKPLANIKDLTLKEQISLLTGSGITSTKALKKKNVPSIDLLDGPHGVRVTRGFDIVVGKISASTVFPCAATLAASWDPDLIEKVGAAIGRECLHFRAGALLGPGVNLKRSEAGGRNFEYYSEDPLLSGKMAASFIRGVQSTGTAACLKHFACNDYENRRFVADSLVDQRTLRDLYLRPFEIAVQEGKPLMVMAAYNMINSVKAGENRFLLTEILRKEWGFTGTVVSDWSSVSDKPASINAGMDLQMPGPNPEAEEALSTAVSAGIVTKDRIEESAGRVLNLVNKQTVLETQKVDFKRHYALTVQTAVEGAVLLKNDEQLLPLNKSILSLAVIGEDKENYQGWGSSRLRPKLFPSCTKVMKELLPHVRVVPSIGRRDGDPKPDKLLKAAVSTAHACSAAVVLARPVMGCETESIDHTGFRLPDAQEKLIVEIAKVNPNTIVVLQAGSAIDMSSWIDDVHAVIYMGMGGEGIHEAALKIIFGLELPSGRLSETFPAVRTLAPDFCCRIDASDKAVYGERQYIGYRYFDKTDYPVQFPFGFGLGYGKMEAADFNVDKKTFGPGDEIRFSFSVKNTGEVGASEVYQLYIGKPSGYYDFPVKELAAFKKIKLAPGENQNISLTLKAKDLEAFDGYYDKRLLIPGAYSVSLNIDAQTALWESQITAEVPDYPVRPISPHDELKKFMASQAGRKALAALIAKTEIKEKIPQLKNIEQLLNGGDVPLFRLVALSGGIITPEMAMEVARAVNREQGATDKN